MFARGALYLFNQLPFPSGLGYIPGMHIGVCVASKIDDVGYIAHAENLGYSHAWVADSQMIWSDCYAVLALAAQRTRTIRLGTGVAIAGTRTASIGGLTVFVLF